MSRRLVSVCILALAGITSISAGRVGINERQASRSGLQIRRIELNRPNRDVARFRCVEARKCATPVSMPVTFEPNVGQFDRQVKYAGRGAGMTLFLTPSGMDVQVVDPPRSEAKPRVAVVKLRAEWLGTNRRRDDAGLRFAWRGERRVRTISNYFVGKDRRGWRINVPHFARAIGDSGHAGRLKMEVYGTRQGVEYDLRLAPGAESSGLRLRLSGAKQVKLDGSDVIVEAGQRTLRMARPKVYEELSSGTRESVRGEYVMESDGSIGFRIGAHNPRATLVVDPSLTLTYATFLGGTGNEASGSVVVDASGNVYVGGATSSSTTFPETNGAGIGPVLGTSAFYVAKFDPTVTGPNSLIYLTFLGGSGTQTGGLIAVDGAGDVALTGTTTSTDFPVTGSSQPTTGLTSGNGNDTVVSEINPQGNQLNFSAYFGGSGEESANGAGGIAIGPTGDVYVASDTHPSAADPSSPDLPVTSGAWQTTWDGEGSDGFLAVFAPPGQSGGAASLTYCSYLGTNSSAAVTVGGIAVDSSGNAYIGGSTSNASNGFPVRNALQSAYGGGSSDGFVMKIAPNAQGPSDLVYATLLGGNGLDEVLAVALDSNLAPKAYVTGETQSTNFPVSSTAYQSKLCANLCGSSSQNTFLAVIAQDAVSGQTSLAYSSYLGGSETDEGLSIAVAAPSSVYVAGQTNSPDFPWHDNLQPFNGATDAFLAKFDPTSSGTASFIYATPLAGTSPAGGSASTAANGVATNGSGTIYVTGQTTAADFPTAATTAGAVNGFQQSCASCQEATPASDAFTVEIAESATPAPSVYFNLGSESFGATSLGSSITGQPLAVLDGGEAPLTISDISVLGPNAGDFSTSAMSACIGTSIAPGPTPQCSMDVNFTPSAGGAEVAFLAVTDNAPGSPQLLELKGVGDAPHAQLSPVGLNFGDQPTGTVSVGQTITITNTGNQNLTFTGEDFSPSGTPFQLQVLSCEFPAAGWNLAPGASCMVQIAFAPSATGPAQGQLQIFDNSDFQSNAEQVVALSGNGVAPAPLAQINPTALAFGSTLVGATSPTQSVTLQNKGSAALDLSAISIGGTSAEDFEISTTGTTCPVAGGTVATDSQCTVAVAFAPQSAGSTKTATINFIDNDPTSPQIATLNGTATSPATLTVSPSSLTFGSESEGMTSTAQTVTITNSGSATAGISGIAIAGSTDFVEQSACPPVLAAGDQCQVSVTFAPAESAAPGTRSGTLKIAGGTPATVSLSGTATQAAISFTTSVNFASQLVGTAGAPQPVTITNSSSGVLAGALAFTEISLGGANKSDFAISANQCGGAGTSVLPGNSCTIQITFQPQASSTCGDVPTRSATLQLQDNAPGSPQLIALSGSAADFCLAYANGQPVSAPIQPGQTQTYPLEIASAGGFNGNVSLSCTAPARDEIGPCAITTNPSSNPPVVQVTSTTPGQFTVSVPTLAPSWTVPRGRNQGGKRTKIVVIGCAWILSLTLLTRVFWKRCDEWKASAPRRLIRITQLAALAIGLAVGMAACGSGSAGSDPPQTTGTSPGTYTIVVTATTTSGGISQTRTASLTLTVE